MGRTRRCALLIGLEHYQDARWPTLPSTRADTWYLKQILEDPKIGFFDRVEVTDADLTAQDTKTRIREFLQDRDPGELALLYFSGHGTRATEDGEFHFVACDTDHDDIVGTGVSAGFVNEQLEACWAPQKIAILDCCTSGGFAPQFDTKPPTAKSDDKTAAPLGGRGVYVLSSSGPREKSYAGSDGPNGPEPSVFTKEIINALRTGKAASGGRGDVSVNDLFEKVNATLRAGAHDQIPVKAALQVDDRIVIARSPHGEPRALRPLSRGTEHDRETNEDTGPRTVPAKATVPGWTELLSYYRDCLLSEETPPAFTEVAARSEYVCLPGPEQFLSGNLDEDGCVQMPADMATLLDFDEKHENDYELWAGYPIVLWHGQPPHSGGPKKNPKSKQPVFAPLLIRRIEVVRGTRLRPSGPVVPDPRLARAFLRPDDAAELLRSFEPSWRTNEYEQLRAESRHLLTSEYEIQCVQELDPEHTSHTIDERSPGQGARNTAVLFRLRRDASGGTKQVISDLAEMTRRSAKIPETAASVLLGDMSSEHDGKRETVELVTPFRTNDSQRAVLTSAMSSKLTVATGPPGTGKSQLVANLVATAEANGQSVLVASTNNGAVNQVVDKCAAVLGSLVRTGSHDYRAREAETLAHLRNLQSLDGSEPTAKAALTRSTRAAEKWRSALAVLAQYERALYDAAEERERCVRPFEESVAVLSERLGNDDQLARLSRRAQRLAEAWLMGDIRRNSFLRKFQLRAQGSISAAACRSIAEFAEAEHIWRHTRRELEGRPSAEYALDALDQAEEQLMETADARWRLAVQAQAITGKHALRELAAKQDKDWPEVKELVRSKFVPGWAVTCRSARRFPPQPALFDLVIIDEASQCAIPDVLPLLFRARRAVVIGDVMQLPHISKLDAGQDLQARQRYGLSDDWVDQERLSHRRHSAFQALAHAAARTGRIQYLLDEHYRCHPKIAEIANELFYDGSLRTLTEVRKLVRAERRPAVCWYDVKGKASRPLSGGSWTNTPEIEAVDRVVGTLLQELPEDASVGVVTPFTAQASTVRARWKGYPRVHAGTVHTFQGRQHDAIVFSLVVGEGMNDRAVAWLNGQIHLWNVGITRARSHLVVVGDAEEWQRRGGLGSTLYDMIHNAGTAQTAKVQQELFDALANLPDADVQLDATAGEYQVDALVHVDGTSTPVMLDEPDGEAEARRLQLAVRRCSLSSPPAVRIPAWQLREPDSLVSTLRSSRAANDRNV